MAKIKDAFVGTEAMYGQSHSYPDKNILNYEKRQTDQTTSGSANGSRQLKNKIRRVDLSYDEWKDNGIAEHI